MKTVQLSLFDLAGMMNKETIEVDDLYRDFQSLAVHQRNNAGYGGDVRAERTIRELGDRGDRIYSQWRQSQITGPACRDAIYDFNVQLWCVKVNGKVCRDIYQIPRTPKVYNPVYDDLLLSRIPNELQKLLPAANVLLVYLTEHEGLEERSYQVTYYLENEQNWYRAGIIFDYAKKKWSYARTTKLYGEQFRADLDLQWWTRAGFEKQKPTIDSTLKFPRFGLTTRSSMAVMKLCAGLDFRQFRQVSMREISKRSVTGMLGTPSNKVISKYTRADAISDGLLFDMTTWTNRAGIKFPVAVSIGVWSALTDKSDNRLPDFIVRLAKFVSQLRNVFQKASGDRIEFDHFIGTDGVGTTYAMYGTLLPGDDLEPVITVLMTNEE